MLEKLKDIIIITGHYGSGKTNFSINLAIALKEAGKSVKLIDLDIVNPYFRTADFKALAESRGIALIAPTYAGSNLDIPVLTGEVDAALRGDGTVVVDVGGDDDGAIALGRYASIISGKNYSMLYILNGYRPMSSSLADTMALMDNIQQASRLKISYLVNNSNLGATTTAKETVDKLDYGSEIADSTGVPLLFNVVRRDLVQQVKADSLFVADVYVKVPWDN